MVHALQLTLLATVVALVCIHHVTMTFATSAIVSLETESEPNSFVSRSLQSTDSLEEQISNRISTSKRQRSSNNKNNNGDSTEKKKKKRRKDKKKKNPERQALTHWADSLTERDYNYTEWRRMFHTNAASDFFNGYARKLSDIFKRYDAKINFAMVGACDGTGDNTIKYLYLPNDHWRGVFVEPISINVRDLIQFMANKNVAHRSLVIRGAATSECLNSTITLERPLYEEKNKTIPHWLRRQIGSILPSHRNHARKEWTLETVRCLTAKDILRDWAAASAGSALATLNVDSNSGTGTEESPGFKKKITASSHQELIKKTKLRRPHILKIDVEGHDYDVLMGFLRHDTPVTELPLIIDFEAKSIAKKFPLAKERMEYLGYVVSPFGNDGFAILKADRIKEGLIHEDQYFPPEEEPV